MLNSVHEKENLKLELEYLRKELKQRCTDLENLEAQKINEMKKMNIESKKVTVS